MGLFDTFEIDLDSIKSVVLKNWGAVLGDCLKSSQNQTYKATVENQLIIIRITPFSDAKLHAAKREVAFVNYVSNKGVHVSKAIPTISSEEVIVERDVIITAYEYASGTQVNFFAFEWIDNDEQIKAIGRWFGTFHNASEEYSIEYPEISQSINLFSENLSSTLAEAPIHPDDEASRTDPHKFGVLHGDVNYSNFFFDNEKNVPCMFDWDQLQRGWFLLDLSQPIWGLLMLQSGNPIDQSPVPQASSKRLVEYCELLIEGYLETRTGPGRDISRESLKRMVQLRREQYARFCSKAVVELEGCEGGITAMLDFCKSVVKKLDGGAVNVQEALKDL